MRAARGAGGGEAGGDDAGAAAAPTAHSLRPEGRLSLSLPSRGGLLLEDEREARQGDRREVAPGAGGAWVLPFWRESALLPKHDVCVPGRAEGPGVLVSEDEGKTWEERGGMGMRAAGTHIIEGSVARVDDAYGREGLVMYFRTSKGVAYASRASEPTRGGGWGRATPTSAPNPDAKAQVLALAPGGPLAYAGNHQHAVEGSRSPCKKCRTNLGISLSHNAGKVWGRPTVVESHRGPYEKSHYPTVVQVGCKLVMVYSRGYSCCAPQSARLGVYVSTYTITTQMDEEMAEETASQ